jgi:DNA modification methylase
MLLLHGDCNEMMKEIPDESVDLIFTDLPFGQVSCEWDKKIDLDLMWKEFMRIKKLHTPLFFCCTTKFGHELITSAPKKCPFRYDIVWVKSAPTAFLLSRKMPLRKHEMLYVFYERLPLYDLSSHKHKFTEKKGMIDGNKVYEGKKVLYREGGGKYDPPLPVSVQKEEGCYQNRSTGGETATTYDPPLPVSVQDFQKAREGLKEILSTPTIYNNKGKSTTPIETHPGGASKNNQPRYDPPLPNSLLEIKSQRGKHSTQKPVQLMSWVLKYYSKEGDVVLDPTMGSGSTGVACQEMNRDFIGIEMNPEYYEISVNRLN